MSPLAETCIYLLDWHIFEPSQDTYTCTYSVLVQTHIHLQVFAFGAIVETDTYLHVFVTVLEVLLPENVFVQALPCLLTDKRLFAHSSASREGVCECERESVSDRTQSDKYTDQATN